MLMHPAQAAHCTLRIYSRDAGADNCVCAAGGIVGGLAALALVLAAFFLYRRRSSRRKHTRLLPEVSHSSAGLLILPDKNDDGLLPALTASSLGFISAARSKFEPATSTAACAWGSCMSKSNAVTKCQRRAERFDLCALSCS